jgi:hypothetical protein
LPQCPIHLSCVLNSVGIFKTLFLNALTMWRLALNDWYNYFFVLSNNNK